MARIFNPQNHLGNALVPVGQVNNDTKKIDISWLDVADTYSEQGEKKIASTEALKSAVNSIDDKISSLKLIHFVKLNALDQLTSDTPNTGTSYYKITKETFSEIATAIFLVPQSDSKLTDDNDIYVEYICTNISEYVEETHGTTGLIAKYEKLGYINSVSVAATESALGEVMIAKSLDGSLVDDTHVPTAKAVKDALTKVEQSLETAKSELETEIGSKIDEAIKKLPDNETISEIKDAIAEIKGASTLKTKVTEHTDLKTSTKPVATQQIVTGEEFVAAYLDSGTGNYVLCMPEVTVSGTTMSIRMFSDTDTIAANTKLKVITVAPETIVTES